MFLEALNFNQLHCTLLVLEFHCIRVIRFIRHCTVFFGARKRRIGLGKPKYYLIFFSHLWQLYNTPTNLFFPAAFGNRTIKGFPLYNSGKKNADFCMVAFAQCSSRRCGLREYFSDYSLSKKLCCLQCAVAIFLQHLHKKQTDLVQLHPSDYAFLLQYWLERGEQQRAENKKTEEPRKLLVMPQTRKHPSMQISLQKVFRFLIMHQKTYCCPASKTNNEILHCTSSGLVTLSI